MRWKTKQEEESELAYSSKKMIRNEVTNGYV